LKGEKGPTMDISVLPNNNHPEKFFQLDVGMLPATHGMFQVGAALSGQRQWSNQVYQQVGHLSLSFKSSSISLLKAGTHMISNGRKRSGRPRCTTEQEDKYIRVSKEKGPQDLDFWLEDLYTPGYDSLLKKKEAEIKRNRLCKILTYVVLSVCVIIIIITVPIIVTRNLKKP
uniref:Membrane integral NOTCH2 associated receptor 2 n=1 Tax=Hucho hucho TaxID=62062 RepID=A0A4W5NA13_9TELE